MELRLRKLGISFMAILIAATLSLYLAPTALAETDSVDDATRTALELTSGGEDSGEPDEPEESDEIVDEAPAQLFEAATRFARVEGAWTSGLLTAPDMDGALELANQGSGFALVDTSGTAIDSVATGQEFRIVYTGEDELAEAFEVHAVIVTGDGEERPFVISGVTASAADGDEEGGSEAESARESADDNGGGASSGADAAAAGTAVGSTASASSGSASAEAGASGNSGTPGKSGKPGKKGDHANKSADTPAKSGGTGGPGKAKGKSGKHPGTASGEHPSRGKSADSGDGQAGDSPSGAIGKREREPESGQGGATAAPADEDAREASGSADETGNSGESDTAAETGRAASIALLSSGIAAAGVAAALRRRDATLPPM